MDPQDLAIMDQKLKRQDVLGSEIEALVRNFKKTALDKRTIALYERRLRQLTTLGREFRENDDWLQDIDNSQKTSKYFKNNYGIQINNLVDEYSSIFTTGIMSFAPKIEELFWKQNDLISEIEKIIAAESVTPAAQKTKQQLEGWIREIEKTFSELETNNGVIKLLAGTNQEHEYFTQNKFEIIEMKTRKAFAHFKELAAKIPTITPSNNNMGQKGPAKPSKDNTSHTSNIVRRQKTMIDSLKRLIRASVLENTDAPSLKVKQNLWEQIQEIHFSIYEQFDDPCSNGYDIDAYINLEKEVMQNFAAAAQRRENTSNNAPLISNVPLPKINIPKFNGEYEKWPTFADLFEKVVHGQPISAVQKMWYLKTNLTGEAERLIRHLALTENNYTTAWGILKDRFNNKRVLAGTLIQQILDLQNISSDANSIKTFHDVIQENLAALTNMEIDVNGWDPLLLQLLTKKLDRHTHGLYEQSIKTPRELQTIENFLSFLEQRFQALESMGNKEKAKPDKQNSPKEKNKVTSTVVTSNVCKLCNTKEHRLYHCEKFKNKMTPAERLNWVQGQRLCVNCFKSDHKAKTCKSRACLKCNQKHNTLLHLEKRKDPQPTTTSATTSAPASTDTSNETTPVVVTAASSTRTPSKEVENYVLLATAKIRIVANNGQTCEARAVLDSGSQVNLITQRIINQLSLNTTKSQLSIEGVGLRTGSAKSRVNVTLEALVGDFSTRIEAFVLPQIISAQPSRNIDTTSWTVPPELQLADPEFFKSAKIDVLIGAEFYHSLLRPQQITMGSNLPLLQNTSLGWIVIGKTEIESTAAATCAIFTHEDEKLSETLEKFWTVENFGEGQTTMTKAELACETHFLNNVRRNEQGRFIVRLPFSEEKSALGESRYHAEKRLEALERRLDKQPLLKNEYIKFLDEYESLGHMEKINEHDIPAINYFIPHHCVLKPDSTTTKLRVVFDASAKTPSGLALNDILQKGPTVQSELVSILLRFRTHRFVFTADIEKMYRQILIHNDDTAQQLIVWRKDRTQPFEYFRLKTVTYGTTSAPYLATKCLQYLASQNLAKYPLGAKTIRDDFYVDDCLSGANDISTSKEMQRQITTLLNEAGFKLRKWCANHTQLLAGIPLEDQEINLDLDNESSQTIKTLGLIWHPKSDQLCGRAHIPECSKITKRTVLSDLARIFDPLGIFGPVTVKAKIFMQRLWEQKVSWDDELPTQLIEQWSQFRENLTELNNLKTYRHVFGGNVPLKIQIHTFVDASEQAYGAAVFVRATHKDKTITTRLLCAKSKIAPMKKLTIPRLELCAAVMGAELTNRVRIDLQYTDTPTFYWTDSEIVLSWIQSPSSTLHTFVANRISRIHQTSDSKQWHHVSSKDNPADILSRGINPDKLASSQQWFYGPFFLSGSDEWWQNPGKKVAEIPNDIERRTKGVVTITSQWSPLEMTIHQIDHRNSFKFLLHTVGYIKRPFLRPRPSHLALTPSELQSALRQIVKAIQMSDFREEIRDLTKYQAVGSSSPISSLLPFIDDHGILRVGGRLEAASLPYDAKHPMLLPYNETITKLIFKMKHEELKHCGPQALLAAMRQSFWPVKGKIMARSTVHSCIKCSKAKPKFFGQLMGNLPADRVLQSRPFLNTGVDYCGPFWIHYKVRGKKPTKAYLAVFCCFSTKAIHLELVSDLTTNGFIGALKRFTSRRGPCHNLYCDNATNFIGAKNQLDELKDAIHSEKAKENIIRYNSDNGINFKFIPPRAPHFGGLWEAAVKSAKHLLLRSVNTASLTYEELETVVIEVEAVLNSRPLTPLSSDPNDLTALTPGHFLIGASLTAPADSDNGTQNMALSTRWRLVSQLKHEFWRRWSKEYLNELQQRQKWKKEKTNIQEGMMVIAKEENLPIMKWPIGRIVKTYTGEDGLVRVAEIRTATGIYKRPIHLLAPLPTESPILSSTDLSTTTPSLMVSIPLDRLRKADMLTSEATPKKMSRLQEDPTHQITSKKNCIPSNIFLAIIALLLIPMALCSSVTHKTFPNKPGLYFEGAGTVNRVVGDWKIITYFDLVPIRKEIELFRKGTATLHELCSCMTQKSMCLELVKKFDSINLEIQRDDKMTKRRKARGAIDIVGNIANKLFGVLDSEYAENISHTINQLNANDDVLLRLIKNQTSVVESTVNIVSKETEAIEVKLNLFQLEVTNFTKQVNNLSQHVDVLEIYTSVSTQLSLMAINLQRIEAAIFDALTDARHGKINPLLISPQQIENEITKIRGHLPSSLRLPFYQDDLIHVYGLMTSQGGISSNHILFILTLPLCSNERFDLFQITPIPAIVNTTLLAIRPEAAYFAITPHRDQYFALTSEDLKACTPTNPTGDQILCSDKPIKYHQGAQKLSCEFNMLRNKTDKSCNIYETNSEIIWSPLHYTNRWIFTATQKTQITAVCNDNTELLELQGSSLLTIPEDCTLKHNTVTIQAHKSYSDTIFESHAAFGDLGSINKMDRRLIINGTTMTLSHELQQLQELHNKIHQSTLVELPRRFLIDNIHQYAVSYASLFLIIITIVWFIWKMKRSNQRSTIQPSVTPPPSPRFSIDPEVAN